MENGQLFTWHALSAMGGASLLTFFIVQYTKTLIDRIATRWGLPTDIYAVFVAWIVLLSAQFAAGAPQDWKTYVLSFANSFLVASAAGQVQRISIDPPGKKSKGEER